MSEPPGIFVPVETRLANWRKWCQTTFTDWPFHDPTFVASDEELMQAACSWLRRAALEREININTEPSRDGAAEP